MHHKIPMRQPPLPGGPLALAPQLSLTATCLGMEIVMPTGLSLLIVEQNCHIFSGSPHGAATISRYVVWWPTRF